ncbi:Protein phosphatase [Aphelenchoides bicaudatus]|nr:Protein phosphatase [Aphelenchoides bicaudatus]
MLNCSKLLIRVGSNAVVRELSVGLRNSGSKVQFCAVAAASTAAATNEASSKPTSPQKVDTACCGFAKDLIGAPSTVLDSNVYGEDACFISKFKSTAVAGVADGVGGWKRYEINPAEFSKNLMNNCSEIVNNGSFDPQRPDLIIANAFHKLSISSSRPPGSSTACVVVVHKKILYAANLGDSGYLVFRDGAIIHKSQEQIHAFNTPFQLTLLPERSELSKWPKLSLIEWQDADHFIKDTPEHADLHKLELQSGDAVLIATDGLWDNLPDNQIIETLKGINAENLQAKCNTIALIARRLSNDESHLSPFAKKAQEYGYQMVGGKAS